MGWISVEEKLPKKNTPVLMHYESAHFRSSCQCVAILFEDTETFRCLNGGSLIDHPTHWMPLPEPPTVNN